MKRISFALVITLALGFFAFANEQVPSDKTAMFVPSYVSVDPSMATRGGDIVNYLTQLPSDWVPALDDLSAPQHQNK